MRFRFRRILVPLVCIAAAVLVQLLLWFRVDWTASTQSHASLGTLRVGSDYQLELERAAGQQSETILSYRSTAEHQHLVKVEMQNGSLSPQSQALLPRPNLQTLSGILRFAPDVNEHASAQAKPCHAAFHVDFLGGSSASDRSITLYPARTTDFKDRERVVHLRSRSRLIVYVSANSQDGVSGPNCRNLLNVADWLQPIGKDLELGLVAAPETEVTITIYPAAGPHTTFGGGTDGFESVGLEPMHPALLVVSPIGSGRVQQIRKKAGSPPLTVTNLRLGGDFLEVKLSGSLGIPIREFLDGWAWPALGIVNLPLLVWLGISARRPGREAGPEARAMAASEVYDALPDPVQPKSGRKRVFLSYSRVDKERVMQIYKLLDECGAEPWIDRQALLGGEDWEYSIKRQMRESHRVLVFLSCASVQKAGYFWSEIRLAAKIADEQPQGTSFIVPLLLDNCKLPDILHQWNAIDLTQTDAEARILQALNLTHPLASA
jgi:hypothetical protein